MAKTPEVIRELRPHAIWSGVEVLWRLVESAVIAALAALILALRSHLDLVAIGGVFVIAFVALALGALRSANLDAGAPPVGISTPAAAQAVDPEPSTGVASDAPNPLIEYRSSGARHELILTTDKQKAVIGPSLGPVICRETYESKYEIEAIPGVLPSITVWPVACQVSGVKVPDASSFSSLVDVLRRRSPIGVAWVVLDFKDSDSAEFSRLFTLHRNVDDSVIFMPSPVTRRGETSPPEPGSQELAALDHKLYLLHAAKGALEQAGRLAFLAAQTQLLIECFSNILADNDADKEHHFKFPQPLSRTVVYLEESEEGAPINKYRLRMMSFRDRYNQHQREVCAYSADSNPFRLPSQIPNQLDAEGVLNELALHANALLQGALSLEKPYLALSN